MKSCCRIFEICLALVICQHWLLAQHGDPNADLSAKKLQPAAGLKAELFAADPLFQNPVAFTIDGKGRVFVSETHRYKDSIFDLWKMDDRWKLADFSFQTVQDRAAFLAREFSTNLAFLTKDSELIRLVEDKDGDGRAESSAVFAEGFNKTVSGTAAGILAHRGDLWFTCIPDLWKFTYDYGTNGPGLTSAPATTNKPGPLYSSREVLHTGFGVKISVSGHDLHGLILGPDDRLYFSVGDRGANVKSKEDREIQSIDRGAIFRCNQDGTHLELVATGLRNPQELAFDEFGNLWTHDNDTSGEDDSRVLHVVEGGDYGWRQSYQFMPGFGPWVKEKIWQGNIDDVLPAAGHGAQGPSGLALYPGVGLPDKYKGALIACDFPQGVWAYFIKPKGASYEIQKEKFLWDLGATDVEFGPDGNAYVSDWGKSYNMPDAGRIFRVFDPAAKTNAAVAEIKAILADGFTTNHTPRELLNFLSHSDMRVRLEAQRYLGTKGKGGLHVFQIALSGTNQLARIHAIWGLRPYGPTAFEAWIRLTTDADPEIRAQALKALGNERVGWAVEPAMTALKDPVPRVRFQAAIALGRLGQPRSIPGLIEMLKENNDQDPFLTHAGSWALASINKFDDFKAHAQHESVAVRRAVLLAMRKMKRPEIAEFLNDIEPPLSIAAARAIIDVPILEATSSLAEMMDDCKCSESMDQRTQFISRALNANFRLGTTINAGRVINFLLHPKAPEEMRAEGLHAIADWEKPGPLDRVVGAWRPLTNRTTKINREGLTPVLQSFVESKSEKIAFGALSCVRKLQITNLAPNVLRALQNTNLTIATRVEALQVLADIKAPQLEKAIEIALADKDNLLRARGVLLSAQMNPAQAAAMLDKMLATETDVRIGQAIYQSLGELKDPAADQILSRQLDELAAKRVKPEFHLELVEAAAKRTSPAIKEKLRAIESSQSQGNPIAAHARLLFGGDAAVGKKIFNERDDVGCLRCHSIKGKGGMVGPDLAGTATRLTREAALEAILFPNAQIATGFENIVVTLKDGISHAGMVKQETETELVLNSPEDGEITLKKAEITRRDRSLSAMPEGMDKLLSKRELRDLVEYLATLK